MYHKTLQGPAAQTFLQMRGQSRGAAHDDTPIVFVINGDVSIRRSLEEMVGSTGWKVRGFDSAAAFFSFSRTQAPGCVLVDTVLPDASGLELQQRLNASEAGLATIFTMDPPNISAAVHAMKAGAVEVLLRPVDRELLLTALHEAILRSQATLSKHARLAALRNDYATLTNREREVMLMVVSGLLNKQVGAMLGISEITVKAHRGQVMRKMKARSFADLVNKAAALSAMSH